MTTSKHNYLHSTQRWGILFCVGMILMLALGACSRTSSSADNDPPKKVVQSFVAAIEQRNASKLLNLIEPADWRKDIGPELRSDMSYLEKDNFRDPQYTVVDNTGELAHVRLVSTMEYEVQGVPPAEQQLDLLFEVVKLDGEWYLRNFDLPTTTTTPTP
jgi:hypothetical protein